MTEHQIQRAPRPVPEKLRVVVLDETGKNRASGVPVYFELSVPRKNNYIHGPLITDNEGVVELAREAIEKEIENTQKSFIMDYQSCVDEVFAIIVSIPSAERVQRHVGREEHWDECYPHWRLSELQRQAMNRWVQLPYREVEVRIGYQEFFATSEVRVQLRK